MLRVELRRSPVGRLSEMQWVSSRFPPLCRPIVFLASGTGTGDKREVKERGKEGRKDWMPLYYTIEVG